MDKRKENIIVHQSLQFAKLIILFCDELNKEKRFIISNQLTKSGTSIGANIWEAQNAESPADFIHKMKIAAKEADETEYWLKLCEYSFPEKNILPLQLDLESIQKILNKIISTSKNNLALKKSI
jgi:four helix bundle protein